MLVAEAGFLDCWRGRRSLFLSFISFASFVGLLGFSACPVASRLLGLSGGFSACFVLLGFSASRLLVAFLGPFYPWIEKLRLTNKARTPCFCSLQRSGFYVRRFQLLPLKVSECCGAFCGRPPGATAQSSSYQENQQQEPRLGARCTKTELPISSPSPKWVRCTTKPSEWWQGSIRCYSGQALDCLDLWEAALVCRCTEELWCSSKDHR